MFRTYTNTLMQIHSFLSSCWYILYFVCCVIRSSWDLKDCICSNILQSKIIKIASSFASVSLWPLSHLLSSSFFLHLIVSRLCLSLRAIMVSHKEFAGAGKQPGLQLWRIENLDLKPVPKALHGCFYTGDAYLLLFTTAAPSYNIHMWLGKSHSVHHAIDPFFFFYILRI